MIAKELINALNEGSPTPEKTCDTIKYGDEQKELKRVAICMIGTADVIRAAHEWGADMLIVHEPIYYDHMDKASDDPVTRAKQTLVSESDMVIYRYHDHMHGKEIDEIPEGEFHYLGLAGTLEKSPYNASSVFTLNEPVTTREIMQRIESFLGVKHARVAGEIDKEVTKIAACFGTPSGVFNLLKSEDIQLVITGEACEWQLGEYARDAATLGFNKSLIVMGHIASERDGMRFLTERLKKKYTEIEFVYFECGEVYL